PQVLPHAKHGDPDSGPEPLIPDDALHQEPATRSHALKVVVVGVVLWAAPVVAFAVLLGRDSVLVDQALFFSGTALVTFGGAYAVLTYVA
ncbi:hypothetical protein NL368_27385, partial [Klebsiella pneumoniae]|nr:hypothetical protein [Klebsiella pneumoniae]